jgi:hypothetical protein
MNQYRCETIGSILTEIEDGISIYEKEHKHNSVCDECCGMYIPVNVVRRLIEVRKDRCCASNSDFQYKRNTVWVVAESRFEWYEVKHICASKEVALQHWTELRDELIKGNQEMVEHCIREGFTDGKDWQKNIELLKELIPGESCMCDYPDLREWELESRQSEQENH